MLRLFLILSLSHKISFNNPMPMADFADGKSVVFIGTGLKKTLGFQLQNNSGFSAETPWFLPLSPSFPMVFPWFSHGFPMVLPWFSWTKSQDVVKKWTVFCPLVGELRDPAMRQRHWAQLMDQRLGGGRGHGELASGNFNGILMGIFMGF